MKGVDSEDNTQLHHEHSFRRYLSYLSKVASISSPSRGLTAASSSVGVVKTCFRLAKGLPWVVICAEQ